MGRPINSKYIGNTSQQGSQIEATAWIPGDAAPSTAWISKQVANKTYNMVNAAGQTSGRVTLVQGGVALSPGQANVAVTPFGVNAAVQFAQEIRNRTVYTFDGNTYQWVFDPNLVINSNQASIQSA